MCTDVYLLITQISTANINPVDIFCRWCKLSYGPMRGQVKSRHFSDARRPYFHFLHKLIGIII